MLPKKARSCISVVMVYVLAAVLFVVLQLWPISELKNIARGVYGYPRLAENQHAPYRIP